jgi:hypothetical protein
MRTFRFAGNGSLKSFLPDVAAMIVSLPGTTQTLAVAKTLAGWQALIAPATTAAIKSAYLNLGRGFEEKTPEPEMTTANTGLKEKTKDFEPEFTAWGLMSWFDYQSWFAADGKDFEFTMLLKDGTILTALTSAGLQTGFSGRLFVKAGQFPKAGGDGKQKACQFDVIFDDVEQSKNMQVVTPSFTRKEIEALSPVGVNLEVVTAYEAVGGTVVLKATKRATGEPYTGYSAFANFEVVAVSGDTGGAATVLDATSSALGLYTLTFLNGAAKMTNDFEVQGVTISGARVTYLSNVLNIPV